MTEITPPGTREALDRPLSAEANSSVDEAYSALAACADRELRIAAAASAILAIYDEFYAQLCEYPRRAQHAFETRDPQLSVRISRERLGLYSRFVAEHSRRIQAAFPALAADGEAWARIDRLVMAMIVDRYDADIAFSFAHSIRRSIVRGVWQPVAYSFPPPSKLRALSMASVQRRLAVVERIDAELVARAIRVPNFSAPFRDLAGDARCVAERVDALLAAPAGRLHAVALEVVEAGFFRDRSAFVVGRWLLADDSLMPFVVALLNGPDGIYVDALLHRVSDIHDLFSSALANFHVTTPLYYQTCVFLFSLMPRRPFGHHYSTIGFNHVGKVAILNEINEQVRAGARFRRSPGAAGTVALGFTFDACAYHLKVIRDRPTRAYKWGAYPGAEAVADKYRVVHEINRAGSMLDNVMYFNLRLDREMFDPALLDEICREAAGSVQVDERGVYLKTLIVQLKIVPLPVYLAGADESATRAVMTSLGNCVRNNAATNIFNKDLDSRNYGVGRYGRVFLFDYDAVERLTEVKIRSNADREPGEEAVPEWVFEDGVVFLPEELEHGLQLESYFARRCFREANGDLLSVDYWEHMQRRLVRGEVPELKMYPESCRLAPQHVSTDGPPALATAPAAPTGS